MVYPLPPKTELRCGPDTYVIESVIGRGGTSIVYSAKQKGTEVIRAIKEACPYMDQGLSRKGLIIQAQSGSKDNEARLSQCRQAVKAEAKIGNAIESRSLHVITFWDQLTVNEIVFDNTTALREETETETDGPDGSVFFIMKNLKENGLFLSQLIEKRRIENRPFSAHELALIIQKTLVTLTGIHGTDRDSNFYLHGDLAPGNIFIENLKDGEVTPNSDVFLTDLGCAKEVTHKNGHTEALKTVFTSPRYIAPEMLVPNSELSQKVDIYAVGCVLLELMEFLPEPGHDLYWMVGESDFIRHGASPAVAKKFCAFLRGCLQELPKKRLCLDDALSAANDLRDATRAKYSICAMPTTTPYWVEHSRDDVIKGLEESKDRPMFLWGDGGSGKTECAIQFLLKQRNFRGRDVAFLTYDGTMRQTIKNIPFTGYDGTMRQTIKNIPFTGYDGMPNSVPNADEEDYKRRLQLIKEYNENTLFVIDNFDSNEKTFAEMRDEPAYKDFLKLPIDVLFTTRFQVDHSTPPLSKMTTEHLLQLFLKAAGLNDKVLDDQDIESAEKLIKLVDHHPLTVELMGSMIACSNGMLSAKQLQQAIEEGAAYDDESLPEVTINWNRSNQELRIFGHLKRLFDLSGLNESQKNVMRYATLLPTEGIDEGLFNASVNEEERAAYSSLKARSWLKVRSGSVSMHPMIREVVIRVLGLDYARCSPFLDLLWDQYLKSDQDYSFDGQMIPVFLNAHRLLLEDDFNVNSAYRAARIEHTYQKRLIEAQALAEFAAETREKQGRYKEAAEAFRLLCNIVADTEVSTIPARMYAEHAYELDAVYHSGLLRLESLAKDYRCLSISNTLHDQQAFLASKASILVTAAILYHAVPELKERLAREASELDDYL